MANDLKTLKLNGHVGFDTLSDQLVSKAVARGFTFNILCVGETGLGKSTLMETLFEEKFHFEPSTHDLGEIKLESKSFELKEKAVKLKLTLVETCGFGDQINKEETATVIVDFINAQYERYLLEELKITRDLFRFSDSRIHVCLYFIAPTGHTLKALDLVMMQELQDKVNIIPIIAKADTTTKAELSRFRTQVMKDLEEHDIDIYRFPLDDEQVMEQNKVANSMIPFAVVASTDLVRSESTSKPRRGRQYPWGQVLVDNVQHCDFVTLRDMLLRTNMEHLRETTHRKHYEQFRKRRLREMGFNDSSSSIENMYTKRRDAQRQQQQEREEAVRQKLVLRVRDKEEELKERERQINLHHEEQKRLVSEERRKFEENKRIFEEELAAFERRKLSLEHGSKSIFTMKKKK